MLPGLDGRKMSKSYDNTIALFAPRELLRRQILQIVTDSREPGERKDTQGSALFQIYQAFATPAETQALRAQAQIMQESYARIQRTADNASALQDAQKIAEKSNERVQDTLNYTTDAAKALKDNKKTEDIQKIVGSATLELLRMQAADTTKITAILANQMKVQVNQAEALGEMVSIMQSERMEKAQAIVETLRAEDAAYQQSLKAEKNKAKQLEVGLGGLFGNTNGKVLGN